jgi:hypothetical protein
VYTDVLMSRNAGMRVSDAAAIFKLGPHLWSKWDSSASMAFFNRLRMPCHASSSGPLATSRSTSGLIVKPCTIIENNTTA